MMVHRNNKRKKAANIIAVSVLVLAAYFLSKNYVQLLLIQGDSMSPTYRNMQIVLLDKYSDNYTSNDVIAFYCEDLSTVLVKRIAAVPGDTVQIIDNTLYVNSQRSSYYADACFSYAGIAVDAITLADAQYFVIGDNIEESKDSRYKEVGIVCKKFIIGKIFTIFASDDIK